ncbi:MAG: accessory gene regulator B family protein [Blautia sp.]|nr:accessory gene regulator B family protein [Lachnoclostridium sp.]MCM1212265.1 accessory gene regulator B family protein [Blautia sp.]
MRGGAGGYHAETSLACFCISGGMLIGVILAVQWVAGLEFAAAMCLQWLGQTTCALAILAVHAIIFIMVIIYTIRSAKAAQTVS